MTDRDTIEPARRTVAYLGSFEIPDKNAAANRVLNNAKALQELGYRVIFCGVDRDVARPTFVRYYGFDYYALPFPKTFLKQVERYFSFSFCKFLLDSILDLTAVILYDCHAVLLRKTIKYCKARGIKVIADVTEWYGRPFTLSPVGFLKWWDTRRVMKRLHKRVDGLIVISRFLEEYYAPCVQNVVRIPPLVDSEEEIWKMPILNRSEKVEFVYSGHPGKGKDQIGRIVRCFATLSSDCDFLFRVIGITEEEFRVDFSDDAFALDFLTEKIVFCGRVSHAESVAALRRADWCVFFREKTRANMSGFPTKFAESVTAGVGLIANRISNIGDYYPLENGVLLDSIDEESIRNALLAAISKGKIKHPSSDMFDYRGYVSDFNVFLGEIEGK